MTYRGVAKGKTIELEEPLPYPDGQSVTVSVEPLGSGHRTGSPAAVLQAMRDLPHLSSEDVAALEQAIEEGKLPARQEGLFDGEGEAILLSEGDRNDAANYPCGPR